MKHRQTENTVKVEKMLSKMSGKLEGLVSINGDIENTFCAKMQNTPGTICEHCYVKALMEYRKTLKNKLERHTFWHEEIIPAEEMPHINAYALRIDAFTELHTVEEAINDLNIAIKNPDIPVGFWSKRPDLIWEAFMRTGYKKPENLRIGYSNPKINGEPTGMIDRYILPDGTPMIDFEFIVVTLEHAIKNNIKINCGRNCMKCKDSCYLPGTSKIKYELLRADQKKGEKMGRYE